MDVIARRLIGNERLEKLKIRDEILIEQLRIQCNQKQNHLSRSQAPVILPETQRQVRAIFDRGYEIMEENKSKEKVEYIKVPRDPSLRTEDRTLVSMLGAVLGFMVCCTVGLVARHHGDSISKSFNESNIPSMSKIGIFETEICKITFFVKKNECDWVANRTTQSIIGLILTPVLRQCRLALSGH